MPATTRALALGLTLMSLLLAASCGGGTNGSPDSGTDDGGQNGSVDRAELALKLARDVIMPELRTFETDAAALEAALEALAAAPTDADTLAAARAAYRVVMQTWQRVEVMQVGPILTGHKDEIYPWPQLVTQLCEVDKLLLVPATHTSTSALGAVAVNRRGLGALEYLLFYESATTSCISGIDFDAWNALTDLPQRRADYAHTAARLVHEEATILRNRWEPEEGNFIRHFETIGQGSSAFANANAALNNITNAMFYLYDPARDYKVGYLSGALSSASSPCMNAPCPSQVEGRFSDDSIDYLRQNVLAFRRLFLGGEPDGDELGFDDLLVSIGQEELSTRTLGELEEILALLDTFTEPLRTTLGSDIAKVHALFEELKDISDILKTEFVSVLDLQLPATAAGDND